MAAVTATVDASDTAMAVAGLMQDAELMPGGALMPAGIAAE
jgi:hypothetical protein